MKTGEGLKASIAIRYSDASRVECPHETYMQHTSAHVFLLFCITVWPYALDAKPCHFNTTECLLARPPPIHIQ